MKLASLRGSERDGRLIVVSRDLKYGVAAGDIAPTLLAAIGAWVSVGPALQRLSDEINSGSCNRAFHLDVEQLAAPLPRTWQWLDASAFLSHGALMSKVFKSPTPEEGKSRPLMYQGSSDELLGANEAVRLPSASDGMDFEAEVAVIVDEVPMSTPAALALEHIKLVMLANDISLRALAAVEMKTGFGWIHAKPATSFSPVAVTLDELGSAWSDGRLKLPVRVCWNGTQFGRPDAGEMSFGFHELIAHAAYSRNLSAGTIIGSGTVSNECYREVGSACIAERRGIELLDHGAPTTQYLSFGDRVRIEVLDSQGDTIFGAIDQRYMPAKR